MRKRKDRKGIHLINWDSACKSRNFGGMGLTNTILFRDAPC